MTGIRYGRNLSIKKKQPQPEREVAMNFSDDHITHSADLLRFARTTIGECLRLLDKRATTPEANRELAHIKLSALMVELQKNAS